ncbi:MAG: folate family ECF transporter S component [Ruminococcaceae bacterium]|nr:folate family ECF transporter S component [Oscillospiraceae bacterium]
MKHVSTQTAADRTLFSTPLTPAYFRCALSNLKSVRMITTTALLCAVCALIDMFFLPIGGAFLRVYFSFLTAGLLCMIAGPFLALPAGILVDTLSFLFSGGDPMGYFPGYALSSMLSFLIYALFLWRTHLSLSRIFIARLTVNVLINVILGSVWKHILYGNAYIVYFISGAIKNIALLPIEAALMLVLYRRMVPILQKLHLIPGSVEVTVRRRDYVFSVIAGLIGIAVLIGYYIYKN